MMGKLEKFYEQPGSNSQQTTVVIVPGLCATSLAEQTCTHFEKWIETCSGSRDTPMTVWIYHHGVKLDTKQCWDYFCAAGGELLNILLDHHKSDLESENTALVLIGHRLGAFILKKALIEAHRRNHHGLERALFEALQTLIMVGDPDLHDDNRHEWTQLVHECLLSSKKPTPQMCSEQALTCLKKISDTFEEVTVQSRFFQVSGLPPAKQRLLRLKRGPSKLKGCVCYANICVRMWSTADDEDTLSEGEGDEKKCVFHSESIHRKTLQWMANPYFDPHKALGYDMEKTILPMQVEDQRLRSGPDVTGAINIKISPNIEQIRFLEEIPSSSTSVAESLGLPTQLLTDHDNPMKAAVHPENHNEKRSNIQPKMSGRKNCEETQCDRSLTYRTETSASKIAQYTKDCNTPSKRQDPDVPGTIATRRMRVVPTCNKATILAQESTMGEHEEGFEKINGDEPDSNPRSGTDDIDDSYYSRGMGICAATPRRRARKLPLLLKLPLRPERFIGREDVLQALKSKFLTDEPSSHQDNMLAMQAQSIAVIQGIGGIGKTATALEFAHRYGGKFDQIFWIRASNQLNIAQSFHEAALALGLIRGRNNHNHAESKAELAAWFESTTSKWLIVFDDADTFRVIDTYLPRCNSGSIIITSRRQDIIPLQLQEKSILTISVPPLTDREILEILDYLLNNDSFPSDRQGFDDAFAVGKLLGGHPLALSVAAAYIACGSGSFSTKGRNWFNLRSRLEGSFSIGAFSGVLQLTGDNGSVLSDMLNLEYMSPEANDFCIAMACLDAHDIQEGILLGGQTYKGIPLAAFPLSDFKFSAARDECIDRSMCRPTGPRSLGMHRAIQQALRRSMKGHKLAEGLNTASILLLAQWPSERKFKNIVMGNWPEFDQLHSHVHSLSELFMDMSTDNMSSTAPITGATSPFTKLLLQSTWYNSCVRGNAEEDVFLIELVHELLASSSQVLSSSKSRAAATKAPMPTRLLRIDNKTGRCKLIDTRGETCRYFALSYCWGNTADPTRAARLTKDTLPTWIAGRHVSDMPRLFRDACDLTLRFGGGYLWIDSLCILQDDDRDKLEEVSHMADIYSNAECTIVKSSSQALFQVTNPRRRRPLRNRLWTVAPYGILDYRGDSNARNMKLQGSIVSLTTWNQKICSIVPVDTGDSLWNTADTVYRVTLNPEQWEKLIKSIAAHANTSNDEDNITKDHKNTANCSTGSSKEATSDVPEQHSQLEDAHSTKDLPQFGISKIDPTPLTQSYNQETSQPKAVQSGGEIIESKPFKQSNQHQQSLEFASKVAEKGIKHSRSKQPLEAIAQFVKARDSMSAFKEPCVESLQGYLTFSVYLALMYLSQQIPSLALDILADTQSLLGQCTSLASQIPLVILGRLYLALGDTHLALDDSPKAKGAYQQAITQFTQENNESLDLRAIAQLKISDIYVAQGDFNEAHSLLQSTVSHFEAQESSRSQAQYARALHRQALLFGAQGKKRVQKVKYAAARQALVDFRDEEGIISVLPIGVLSTEDFEKMIEFGFT